MLSFLFIKINNAVCVTGFVWLDLGHCIYFNTLSINHYSFLTSDFSLILSLVGVSTRTNHVYLLCNNSYGIASVAFIRRLFSKSLAFQLLSPIFVNCFPQYLSVSSQHCSGSVLFWIADLCIIVCSIQLYLHIHCLDKCIAYKTHIFF